MHNKALEQMFALPQTGPAPYWQRVIDGKKLAQQLAAGMSSLANISDFLLDGAAAIQATFPPGETVGSATALRTNPPLQVETAISILVCRLTSSFLVLIFQPLLL